MRNLITLYHRGGVRALLPWFFNLVYPRLIASVLGVDVSHWNGVVNYDRAAAAGARFVIAKATQGSVTDSAFVRNWTDASGKLLRGAYHWLTLAGKPSALDYNGWAEKQARIFAHAFNGDMGEIPPVVDYEDATGAPSAGTLRAALVAFLKEFELQTGVKPMIYTSPGFWRTYGSADLFWKQYELWIAHYGVASPTVPAPWASWRLWQYAPNGPGPTYGMQSRSADLNLFNGFVSDLSAWSAAYRAHFDDTPEPPVLTFEQRLTALEDWRRRVDPLIFG